MLLTHRYLPFYVSEAFVRRHGSQKMEQLSTSLRWAGCEVKPSSHHCLLSELHVLSLQGCMATASVSSFYYNLLQAAAWGDNLQELFSCAAMLCLPLFLLCVCISNCRKCADPGA